MICPGCQRDNHPGRRYCGRCGCNLDPVCRSCSFANDRDDRFCGGCGYSLTLQEAPAAPIGSPPLPRTVTAAPAPHAAVPAHAAQMAPAPQATAAPPLPVDELAGLFAPRPKANEAQQLPDTGIVQGDLDRLFGGTP